MSNMTGTRVNELADLYRRELLDDVIPFWMKHSLDIEHGGYLTCLDREGAVYGTDKSAWPQARQVWMLSKLYNQVEPRQEWLDAARLGADFLREHAFDAEGRMYFALTRDGRPLYKPWGMFSETFAVIGFAEYAKASGREEYLALAQKTFWDIIHWLETDCLPKHSFPETRKVETHAVPMILLATAQELGQVAPDPRLKRVADDSLERILWRHARDDKRALLETISSDGSVLDSPEGRCINPGHAIESAWFVLREGRSRGDSGIIERALQILDWSLEWGWDKEHGGLLYFVDSEGRPPEQLEWDMKLWWPHTEALYALLLAYKLSGRQLYWGWFEKMHEWTFSHFPDPQYGEWLGYLHRDGSPSLYFKGSMWKGCFHLPRALFLCFKLLEEIASETGKDGDDDAH